jgi:serine/threonine protein kinase
MVDQASRNGQLIGNYRLFKILGRGGFAEVYLAEHIHLNTQAAVKLLSTQLAYEDVEIFRNEARMIASLLHPHIVRVLDFGDENSIPYLVMDYEPNGTLRLRHPKGSRLPLQLVVSYVQQIANALQYAHEKRVIHRDIKPENMLIRRNHEIILTDFGIALVAQSSHYQKTQSIAGTLAYMAPEQIQAHPRPASDQYSLGIVIYEWLGGQRPFQGTMTEIAIKHATAIPPSLRLFAPDLPIAVEQVVLMALQKNPHDRFPSVLAFAQALERASNQFSQSPASGFTLAPSTNRLPPLQQFQMQSPSQYRSQTLPYPGYHSYPTYQSPPSPAQNGGFLPPSSTNMTYSTYQTFPPQAGQSPQLPQARRVSRRIAIATLAVGTAAIVGSGLAYDTYTSSRNKSSNILRSFGSYGPNPGFQTTPTASQSTPLATFNDHTKTIWAVSWSPN